MIPWGAQLHSLSSMYCWVNVVVHDDLRADLSLYRYDLGVITYIGYNYASPYHIGDWVRVMHAAMSM